MSEIILTQEQLDQIYDDLYYEVELLDEDEVVRIANKLNGKINLPFLDEEKEFRVFVKIIRLLDRALYALLPNEYYELIRDATDGIDDKEAERIKKRVTPLINRRVNIPVLSERKEKVLIELVLDIIIGAMRKNEALSIKQTEMKYKEGDVLEIIANKHGHGFELREIVTVVSVNKYEEPEYGCLGDYYVSNGKEEWCVREEEVKKINDEK